MARLLTAGAESKDVANLTFVESPQAFTQTGGGISVTGAPTADTTIKRTGAASFKFNTAAGSVASAVTFKPLPSALADTVFCRAYMQFTDLPTTGGQILNFKVASAIVSCRLSSGGKFQLWNETGTPAQIGSNSAATVTAADGIWYRVELSVTIGTGSVDACELQVDGVSVASGSSLSLTDTVIQSMQVGWCVAGMGTSKVCYADDVAVNNSTGASQNTWPGPGKVVLLLPTSDNSAGSWRAGSAANAAANGALFEAINNTPPVGTATPLAVTAGISNAISGATNPNGDFNMATYASQGIGASDVINAVTLIVVHGEDVSTGAKTGTFTIVSNPTQSGTDTIGDNNSGQFGPSAGGAVATYASGWIGERGSPQYPSSVTVGTSPVARITKVDTGTRAADCCFMGLYVDYTPAVAASLLPPRRHRNLIIR